ncbi:hypothetical protein OPT61_g8221 [Boeremia exigua]|uniref:Uncharacterized protein n=1 Tax=Boeremia exigua TaxID=749465 RepID=A0ACC2HZI3_9PLEO|nr:hypothetical protein OPT61_g8221 [Boeremia exigua]
MGDYTPPGRAFNNTPTQHQSNHRFNCRPPTAPRSMMSQHNHHRRQMLFVKNVPQESAAHIASLFTQYKPLEVRNLYPTSCITTFMVALPTEEAAEEALRNTDGLRIESTVLTVERYNARQSTVARRDARRRNHGFWRGTYNPAASSNGDTDNDSYDADGESQVSIERPSSADAIATQASNASVFLSQNANGGHIASWANVASGASTDQHGPLQAPQVEEPTRRPYAPVVSSLLPRNERRTASIPSVNGADAEPRHAPPLKVTGTSSEETPARIAPKPATFDPNRSPLIARTPAILPPGRKAAIPHPRIVDASSHSQEPQTREGPALAEASQTQSREETHVEEGSGQQTQASDILQQPRTCLVMPIDTSRYIQERHCRDCAFCQKRLARRT